MSAAGGKTAGAAGTEAAAGSSGATIKVTLQKSLHGQLRNIIASARGLGLRRRHQSVVVADTAQNRGMIQTAGHLLTVERN